MMEARVRDKVHTATASVADRLIITLGSHIGKEGLGRSNRSGWSSNNGDWGTRHLGHKLSLWERYNRRHRARLLCSLLTRGDCFSGARSNETSLHHPLDQPVSFSKTGRTSVKTLGAQIIIPMLAYTAVVVLV